MLVDAGVVLVVIVPGSVCVAGFSRNVERASRTLAEAGARLLVAQGSEWLDVEPTPAFLRSERRTLWGTAFGRVDIDFEPLPGVDYGALLLDADDDDDGPPRVGPEHRDAIINARAAGPPRRPTPPVRRR